MNYWKLKCRITEINALEQTVNNLISKIDELRTRTFKEFNLDIDKKYKMNDETETVEEIDGTKTRT